MIKSERLSLVIELLTSQMNHWLFFPIVMTVLGISTLYSGRADADRPDLLMWAVCGLFPIAFFLIRYYAKRLWLFILCHIAVAAFSLILPVSFGIVGRVICAFCATAYTIYSFSLRLKEEPEVYSGVIHPIMALVVSAASNFLLHRQKNVPEWDQYYLFILIGVLACYLFIYYLKQYANFLRVNVSSAGYVPAKEILRSGIGFVLPYTLIGVLILVLSLNVTWLEPVLYALKTGIIVFLRFIFGLFSGESIEETEEIMDNSKVTGSNGQIDLPKGETFWLWEVLEYIAIVLFICALVFVFVRAIILFIRLLRDRFGNKADNYAYTVNGGEIFDVREKCSIAKNVSGEKQKGFLKRFTPVERIRRMYKKQVLSGKIAFFGEHWSSDKPEQDKAEPNKAALNCMTAKECGERLSMPDMAEIYEQVRYSDREITSEDVKRMKLACRN